MIGQTISHYKIIDKLGTGGMGVVYKAEDTKLKRTVALKFLPPALSMDDEAKTRFIQEARAASALDHPNICTIHEIGETADGQSYIAMACYEGESLKEYIVRTRRAVSKEEATGTVAPQLDQIISITIQIAKGLARAHEEGIIHRDIKPANIMITDRGEVKILDFGLAKLAGQSMLTKTGTTLGTVAYMSPEQTSSDKIDQRSDIWSLGVVLYEMLTGKLPFQGSYEQAIIYSILNEQPVPLNGDSDIPEELKSIVIKALAKDPNERYSSIDEMLQDFKPLSKDAAIIREESFSQFVTRSFRKKPVRYTTISAGVLLILIIAFLFLRPVLFKDMLYAGPPPIMVISFENQTGDESFEIWEKLIPEMLITKLEQSGGLMVTPWERISDLKKQLGKDSVEFVDRTLGYELARKDGVRMVVTGTLIKAGDMFAIDAKVMDVETREILKSASVKGKGEESLLMSQIDELGEGIARELGHREHLKYSIQDPIRHYTTSSMAAYKLFIQADTSRPVEGIPLLLKAIELDSTFASAHDLLSEYYFVTGQKQRAIVELEKAKIYSDHASEAEKLRIHIYYYFAYKEDMTKSDSLLQIAIKKYPRYKISHRMLANVRWRQKRYDEAVELYKTYLKMVPDEFRALIDFGYLYVDMEQYESAIDCLKKSAAIKTTANTYDSMADIYYKMGNLENALTNFIEGYKLCTSCYYSALKTALCYAQKEEYSDALIWAENGKRIKRPEVVPYQKAFYHYMAGQYDLAEQHIELSLHYGDSLFQEGFSPNVVIWLQHQLFAWMLYDMGEFEMGLKAMQKARNNLDEEKTDFNWANSVVTLNSNLYSGLIFTHKGILDSAKYHLKYLFTLTQDSTFEHLEFAIYFHNLLKAEILMAESSFEETISLLHQTIVPRRAGPPFRLTLPFKDDLLAQILINLDESEEAIEEYERLTSTDLKERKWNFIHPRYRYRLAKLYEQKGWPGKAIEQYKRFLEVWKNADKDLPELIDAKQRMARLIEK